MRHHRCQLAFVVGITKQRRVKHHVATEESEGVKLVVIHNKEMERRADRIGMRNQTLPEFIDVLIEQRVVNQRGTGAHLTDVEIAHLQFLINA